MDRRKIEAVLLAHRKKWHPHTEACDCVSGELVSDLLACQPSRKGLEKLFKEHSFKYATGRDWVKAIQDAIMIWAGGEVKAWCKDWKWDSGRWVFQPPSPFGKAFALDAQQFCHICGTPRPTEGRG